MSANNQNDLIFQKEKEWRDLLVSKFEDSKQDRELLQNELDDLRDKFNQLHTDFKHNLQLLLERENELREVEQDNDKMHESVCRYEEQISDQSVEIERLREDIVRGERAVRDTGDKIGRLREQAVIDARVAREEKMREIERVRGELGERVRELERALVAKDERLSEERLERERLGDEEREDIRKERSECEWRVVQHEMKYRLASKELELSRASKAELVTQVAELEERVRSMELTMNERELASASELSLEQQRREQERETASEIRRRLEQECERLANKVRGRDESLTNKAAVARRLENELRQVLGEASERERLLANELEVVREREERGREHVAEYERVVSDKEEEVRRMVARMSDVGVSKDGELRTMRMEAEDLRRQLRERQEQMQELRQELEYAVARDLEDSRRREGDKEVLEGRMEKVRVEEMAKVEGMIKTLTRTRDEALAEVRELRRMADERKEVRICTTCSKNPPKDAEQQQPQQQSVNNDELRQLQQQNEQLKTVISRMTDEATKDIKSMANSAPITNNKHIALLAERNRQLSQEKIDLLATSRKLQARFEGLETENGEMKRAVRERETELSQVRFELDSLTRHSGLDNRTLRRRVQELETELDMGRKEAAEYYKGNLELGRVVEDLQAELTLLKSEEFGKVPSLNFGAQEMIIEQLKKEIGDLRSGLSGIGRRPIEENEGENIDGRNEIRLLRGKLKVAANHIKNMANEKQVLIQLSNRLRSELKNAGIKIVSDGRNVCQQRLEYKVDNGHKSDVGHTINDLETKLHQLERLQRDVRANYYEDKRGQEPRSSSRDGVSSVGGQSVEDVFRLLEDSDSLGKSSVCDRQDNKEHNALWSRTVRLHPPKNGAKRNMIVNRR